MNWQTIVVVLLVVGAFLMIAKKGGCGCGAGKGSCSAKKPEDPK